MSTASPFLLVFVASLIVCHADGNGGGGEETVVLEEEAEVPKKDVIAAAMLLAAVTYMMATLEIANVDDRELRKLTWKALHVKISIFCAVLMYQAISGVYAVAGAEDETGTTTLIMWEFLALFVWFLVLQVATGSIRFKIVSEMTWQRFHRTQPHIHKQAMKEVKNSHPHMANESSDKVHNSHAHPVFKDAFHKSWSNHRDNLLECWGVLMGHIVGFAAIGAWGQVQQRLWNEYRGGLAGSWAALAVVPIMCLTMFIFYAVLKAGREVLVHQACKRRKQKSEADDEENVDETLEAWEEKVVDTENDGVALTLSFLFCQVFRAWASGFVSGQYILPNTEGEEERTPAEVGHLIHKHGYGEIGMLLFLGFVLFGLTVVWKDLCPKKFLEQKITKRRVERMTDVIVTLGAMTIAWTILFGTTWLLDTLNQDFCHPANSTSSFDCGSGGMSGTVLLATLVTLFSYSLMMFVRHEARSVKKKSKVLRDILKLTLDAQGLMIGFSWEKSFDRAVEDVSDQVQPAWRKYARLVMAMSVCAMVMCIWLWHILPMVVHIQTEEKTTELFAELFVPDSEKEDEEKEGEEKKKPLRDPQTPEEKFQEEVQNIEEEFEEAMKKARTHMEELRGHGEEYGAMRHSGLLRAHHVNHMRALKRLAVDMSHYDHNAEGLFKTGKEMRATVSVKE